MELVWTNKLSVGNAIIDCEHRNLISMVRDVAHEIRARDIAALLQTFGLLENWLHAHFANEEKIALATEYPFEQHKVAQQYLLKEFRYMRAELVSKNGLWSDGAIKHFSRSLKNWMIDEHILKLDMRMKPALQAYGYDFLPGQEDSATGHARREVSLHAEISNPSWCGCGCGCDEFANPARNAATV